jgi:hypothetical protein
VIEQCRADTESPGKHLERGGSEFGEIGPQVVPKSRNADTKKNGRHDMVPLKKTELWKLHEVLHQLPSGFNKLRAQDPPNVSPPHAVDTGWMNVFLSVRELMMMPVVRCPPDRALLGGGRADERENKLEPSTCLVASMREVSMIDTSNSEHSDSVEGETHRERYPAKACPEDQETSKMNRPKRRLLDQINGMERIAVGVHVFEMSPGPR